MEINKKYCMELDVALFLYLFEHNEILSKVSALDFRNWCYKKEKQK